MSPETKTVESGWMVRSGRFEVALTGVTTCQFAVRDFCWSSQVENAFASDSLRSDSGSPVDGAAAPKLTFIRPRVCKVPCCCLTITVVSPFASTGVSIVKVADLFPWMS